MSSGSIILRIHPDGSRYSVDIIGPDMVFFGRQPIDVTPQQLQARNQTIRDRLNRIVRPISDRLQLTVHEMQSILRDFAREGFLAFDEVFPGGSQSQKIILSLLDDPRVATIRVCAKDFALPWELFCAKRPGPPSGGTWSRPDLWGERYVIHRSFPLNRLEDGRRRTELRTFCPLVSLAAYRQLKYVQQEISYLQSLSAGKRISLRILRDLDPDPGRREEEMLELASFLGRRNDIAHFACHVRPDQYANRSSLVVSNSFMICADDMKQFGVRLDGQPLVILNACDTGLRDPLQTAGLVASMLGYGEAVGVVATECEVPSRFASAFAEQFYEKLLGELPIGQALLDVRTEFMRCGCNNPLGLLYSLYQVDPAFHLVKAM